MKGIVLRLSTSSKSDTQLTVRLAVIVINMLFSLI